jgi:hypothetical protein
MNFDPLPANYSRPGLLHLQPKLARRGDLFAAFLNFQQNRVNFYGSDGIIPAACGQYLCEGRYWL